MKHFFALLLSVLMVLSLLTACGDKTTPSDGDDQTVTDENGSDTDKGIKSPLSNHKCRVNTSIITVILHIFFHRFPITST